MISDKARDGIAIRTDDELLHCLIACLARLDATGRSVIAARLSTCLDQLKDELSERRLKDRSESD